MYLKKTLLRKKSSNYFLDDLFCLFLQHSIIRTQSFISGSDHFSSMSIPIQGQNKDPQYCYSNTIKVQYVLMSMMTERKGVGAMLITYCWETSWLLKKMVSYERMRTAPRFLSPITVLT